MLTPLDLPEARQLPAERRPAVLRMNYVSVDTEQEESQLPCIADSSEDGELNLTMELVANIEANEERCGSMPSRPHDPPQSPPVLTKKGGRTLRSGMRRRCHKQQQQHEGQEDMPSHDVGDKEDTKFPREASRLCGSFIHIAQEIRGVVGMIREERKKAGVAKTMTWHDTGARSSGSTVDVYSKKPADPLDN